MTPHFNRYAFTNLGPLTVEDGGDISTSQLRALLGRRGIVVDRWVRNWAQFIGWQDLRITLGNYGG
jgi:hypothetical protein